ncbi:hypothetical protein Tco_0947622 [Tanacetum coccineum]
MMLMMEDELARKFKRSMGSRRGEKLVRQKLLKLHSPMSMTLFKPRLNADKILAEKLQEEEREKFTIKQRAQSGYKHAQLNKKKFEEIQVMYEKVKRANENFIPIGSAKDEKLIEKINKKADGMDKEEVSEEPEKWLECGDLVDEIGELERLKMMMNVGMKLKMYWKGNGFVERIVDG